MMKRIFILLAACLMIVADASAAKVSMSVSAPRGKRSIEVGDLFYINVEVADMEGSPEKPASVPGAALVYFDRTGTSSRMSSINGQVTMSSSSTWTMTLRATKEGSFSFGPISVGGVKSNAVSYNIGKAEPQAAQPAVPGSAAQNRDRNSDPDKPKYIGKGDGNLFLKANVSSTSVYEQESLVYTVKLYTTYDAVKFIGATAAPKFEGFVVEESKDISKQLDYETYQGKTYATAIIARYIIFPQMTGSLKVLGNTYTISVDEREYYHDPFWGSLSYSKPLQLNVTPNDLTINVKALPFPKPADFSGGVGKFSIDSKLGGNNFATNQAASIKYTVTGTGNLKYIQLPDLNSLYPPELEVYSPTTDVKANVGSNSVSGTASFDYSFMPLEEGEFRIPDVKLVYFDPSTGKYETSVAKGYDIRVGRGAAASARSGSHNKIKFDSELQPVKESDLSKSRSIWINTFAYWLFYIIPVVSLGAVVIGYRRYMAAHADMAAFNSRRANKMARRRLRAAAAAMKHKDEDKFYDEILIALWGYLGDKLKMPNSELMRDNIKTVLADREVGNTEINNLVNLLDQCEFAKFATGGNNGNMPKVYDEATDIINELEKSFKK